MKKEIKQAACILAIVFLVGFTMHLGVQTGQMIWPSEPTKLVIECQK